MQGKLRVKIMISTIFALNLIAGQIALESAWEMAVNDRREDAIYSVLAKANFPTERMISIAIESPEYFSLILLRFPAAVDMRCSNGQPMHFLFPSILSGGAKVGIEDQAKKRFLSICRIYALAGGDLSRKRGIDNANANRLSEDTLEVDVENYGSALLKEYQKILQLSKDIHSKKDNPLGVIK